MGYNAMSSDRYLPILQRNPPTLFSGQNTDSRRNAKIKLLLFTQDYGSDLPSNFAWGSHWTSNRCIDLKTHCYVVKSWFEEELIFLSEVKVSVVGLNGA